jgi:hypothetical protein
MLAAIVPSEVALPQVPALPERPEDRETILTAYATDLLRFAEKYQAAPPGSESAVYSGPLSEADTPSRWGKRFGFSAKTFIRRFKAGAIRGKRLSDKSYRVALADLPATMKK